MNNRNVQMQHGIGFFFDVCTNISCKINKRSARSISILICVLLNIMWIMHPIFEFAYCGYSMLFGITIVSILSCRQKPIVKNVSFFSLSILVLMSILFFLSALIFIEGNKLVFSVTYGILLTIVNIIMSNESNRSFFVNVFCISGQISFVILFIASALFAPYNDNQYSSITLNPNYLSILMIPIIIGTIWLYEHMRAGKRIKSFLLVIFAFEMAFLLMTRSRTGMLSVLFIICVWIIYIIISRSIKDVIKVVSLILILSIISMQIITFLFPKSTEFMFEVEKKVFGKIILFTTTEVIIADQSEDNINIVENNNKDLEFYSIIDGAVQRAQQGSEAGEDVSSGRFAIWKECVNNLNLKGHSSYETFEVGERNLKTNDPHNMVLSLGFQVGYGGIIVAILLIMQCAFYFIYTIRTAIKERRLVQVDFFYLMLCGAFFIVAMFSSTYTPLGSMLGFAFWCTLPVERG